MPPKVGDGLVWFFSVQTDNKAEKQASSVQNGTAQFINQLYAIEGVSSATPVSYNGKFMA